MYLKKYQKIFAVLKNNLLPVDDKRKSLVKITDNTFFYMLMFKFYSVAFYNAYNVWFSGIAFPIWLQNRLISAGLEPVLNYTEKLCK